MMTSATQLAPLACRPPCPSACRSRSAVWLFLPRVARSVPAVRHRVDCLMQRWNLLEVGEDAALLASELAANAVRHAVGSGYAVAVSASAKLVLVEVFDAEPQLPVIREPDHVREYGRGLATVAALATDWGAFRCGAGKCAWFTLQLPAAA